MTIFQAPIFVNSCAKAARRLEKRHNEQCERRAELVAGDDRKDFDFANRGFIATRTDPIIKRGDGRTAFNLSSYAFLEGEAPQSANASLWRQAQILTKHGLFKVMDRIYQVRGFDISTVSFIDAGTGWIVVDPLTSVEVAKAALDLVTEQGGRRCWR